MRKTLLVIVLIGSGCSVTPTSELDNLYVEHARCIEAGAVGCEVIWKEIERRERIVASRERDRECPAGTTIVGNAHGPTSCVPHAQVRTLLNGRLR